MFKKIVLFACLLLPSVGAFSQESAKVAYVATDEIFSVMPETENMKSELEKLGKQFESEEKSMTADLTKKYTLFLQQQDSLTESIKLRRQQELQDLQERITNYRQQMSDEYNKKQQELIVPIQKKVLDAIKAIGEENGYTYIQEKSAFLYISTNATNATPLVKKKLGLPDVPVAPTRTTAPASTPSSTGKSTTPAGKK